MKSGKHENEGKDERGLFPRTAARVMAGPAADRMVREGEVGNRKQAKQALRQAVAYGLEHIRD